jgi:hypothetical protein
MELRNGKRLLPTPPNRVNRLKPRPFRLLDLLTELRLMVYGYAFGYENVHWTVALDYARVPEFVLALGRPEGIYGIKHDVYLQKRRSSLLKVCSQVSQEAAPVFYNQTRFDILFRQNHLHMFYSPSPYKLYLTYGGAKSSSGELTRAVLHRLKHIRFNFTCEPRIYPHVWQMQYLRTFLDQGGLKSLQFVVKGSAKFIEGSIWYTQDGILDFESYRGNAILVLCGYNDYSMTDGAIKELKKGFRGTHYCSYSLHFHNK